MFQNEDLVPLLPRLRKLAGKLTKDDLDADDLVQDTVLRAIEKKNLFRNGTSLLNWTCHMMRNVFINGIRQNNRKYDEKGFETQERGSPEIIYRLKETFNRIDDLDNIYKEAVYTFCVEGYTAQEAGKIIGIRPGNVSLRIFKARKELEYL